MTLTTLRLSEPFGDTVYLSAGQGEPVVLIHGVGMQSAAWGPQVDALAQTHRVIAVNMPGHGGSDAVLPGGELPDYVAWLHAVLTALDLGPVNVAGHSMGALVASGFAVTHPDMVKRVALLNGVYCRSETARAAVIARSEEIGQGAFDLDTPLKRWFGDSARDRMVCDQVSGWLSQVNPQGYAMAYRAFARGDAIYADKFGEISCPLLALTGRDDRNSSPDMAEAMAAAAQNGTALVIEGHRHMVNLTAPEPVTAALQDWLGTSVDGGQDD